MRCPKCGAEINDAAKFCTSCGTPIAQRGRPQRQGYSSPGQQTVRRQTASRAGQQGRAAGSRQAYSQPYGERQPKKKFPVVPLIALLLVAVVAVQLIFHPFGGGKNKAEEAFGKLCQMTSLGTESYLYARILTEQLLETDIMTADPAKVNALFDQCLSAWEAAGKAAGQMSKMAQSVSKMSGLKSVGGAASKSVLGSSNANATGQEAITQTLSAEESVVRCTWLAGQFSGDMESCTARVRELRNVYNGRGTSVEEWNNHVSYTATSCTTVVFLSGQVTEGETTLLNNGEPHSLRTISHDIKRGSIALQNTNVLVDVGETSAAIVMGSNDTVTVNQRDIADSLPNGNSSVISLNTHPEGANDQTITFHRTSLSAWFVLDGVGGFTISRGEKGTHNPVTPPEVPGGIIAPPSPDLELTDTEINQGFPENCGFPRPEVPNQEIDEWTPPIIPQDVETEIENITNPGNVGSNTSTPSVNNRVDESTLDDQRRIVGAADGTITVSMLWGTHDDVDLHMDTPDGSHIYYSNKTAGGGTLDVDMNASELVDHPIENIYFPDPAEGHYKVYIRDYRDRTPDISTHYLVRVNVAGEERTFEGDIDATGTEIVIFEFDYVRSANQQPTVPPLNVESLDERLSNARAGVGDITVSLAWNSWDDVDLHMNTPNGGHIFYRNKTAGGGTLDVDRNAGSERVLDPVENIYFATPENGHYKVYLNDYADRTDGTTRYIVRVTIGGQSQTFEGTIDGTGTDIPILEFDYGGAPDNQEFVYEGHRYVLYGDGGSMYWSQARDFCKSMGGHLATVTSSEEMAFIANMISTSKAQAPSEADKISRPWIGAYGMPGLYNWVTGEDFGFSNFADGKPDNNGQDEFFLHIVNDNGQWNDLNNADSTEHLHRGFICEYDNLTDLDEASLNETLENVGAQSGDITISMLWDSTDDFDLHVFTPDGTEIYYSNPQAAGGELDVDANSDSDNLSSSPVENIYFADPVPGQYWVYVNNYADRTPDSAGNYLVRVTVGNESRTYTGSLADEDETVEVMGFQYNGVQRQS